jgi:EAL domain-containing protein (putative c-di-GMP-specific phosphodiesterase class I)
MCRLPSSAAAIWVSVVMSALAQSGLAPDRIELEITESVLLDNGLRTSTKGQNRE